MNKSITNIEAYLKRINYSSELEPAMDCLKELHRCHAMNIPFEVLDVHFNQTISLDIQSIFNKVVLSNRGGYCYELNHLFYSLLVQVGFQASMISSRIYNGDELGPEFDHMSIIVQLEGIWLVDVGYGDLFIEPLRLVEGVVQKGHFKDYKIESTNQGNYLLSETIKGQADFVKRYSFDLKPRKINEFYDQNMDKQTSSDSYFVKNMICTLPTEDGRKTIFNDNYKVRTGDRVNNRPIKDKEELSKILLDEFNIVIN